MSTLVNRQTLQHAASLALVWGLLVLGTCELYDATYAEGTSPTGARLALVLKGQGR